MKRKRQCSTSAWLGALALASGFALAGCFTIPVSRDDMLVPLDLALNSEIDALKRNAEAGQAMSQLALSIVNANGLRDQATAPEAASYWRSLALSNQRVMPITQYTAAFNGQPSRVNIINVPVAALSPIQLTAIDQCVASLKAGMLAPAPCGDTDASRERRRQAWSDARARTIALVAPQHSRSQGADL